MGKQASQPVPKKTENKAKKALELVYSDVLGPFKAASLSESKYAVIFIGEYTKYQKSTAGYYFTFQGNGSAIRWEVKKQATVALSSTEAEYQAMASAVQEAIYLRALTKDFGYLMKESTNIGEDNQPCIKMYHNLVMHKRSKHIDTKLHFIRERDENGEVGIHYIPTNDMTADILTKSLPRVKGEKHCCVLSGN